MLRNINDVDEVPGIALQVVAIIHIPVMIEHFAFQLKIKLCFQVVVIAVIEKNDQTFKQNDKSDKEQNAIQRIADSKNIEHSFHSIFKPRFIHGAITDTDNIK